MFKKMLIVNEFLLNLIGHDQAAINLFSFLKQFYIIFILVIFVFCLHESTLIELEFS